MVIPMPRYRPATPSVRSTPRAAAIGPPACAPPPPAPAAALPCTCSLALMVSMGWQGSRARALAEVLAARVGRIDGSGSGSGSSPDIWQTR